LARHPPDRRGERRAPGAGDARLSRSAGALAPGQRDCGGGRGRRASHRSGGRLMQRFAGLYDALDATTSTNRKVAAMQAYFAEAPAADAAWAVFFLTGGRLKRLIAPRLLASWAMEATRTPDWMFGECWAAAGDQSEIVALLLDAQRGGTPRGTSGLSL